MYTSTNTNTHKLFLYFIHYDLNFHTFPYSCLVPCLYTSILWLFLEFVCFFLLLSNKLLVLWAGMTIIGPLCGVSCACRYEIDEKFVNGGNKINFLVHLQNAFCDFSQEFFTQHFIGFSCLRLVMHSYWQWPGCDACEWIF